MTLQSLSNGDRQSATIDKNSERLSARNELTSKLQDDSYNIDAYAKRCIVYRDLGYPDLAAMDAYKMLLLVDEIMHDGAEFHEEAIESLRSHLCQGASDGTQSADMTVEQAQTYAQSTWALDAYIHLADSLLAIGCLRNAFEYIEQARRNMPDLFSVSEPALELYKEVLRAIQQHLGTEEDELDRLSFEVSSLPDKGFVRREVYPWNVHEVDRLSSEGLDFLNGELSAVAPKLQVDLVNLPALTSNEPEASAQTVRQLGVFAKEDIAPGEEVLRERSLLTASSRLHEPLCDACSSLLPELGQAENHKMPVPCPECADTIFCSEKCQELAQSTYHEATCGMDIDAIARDVPAAEAADSLYTLLLVRAIAMSLTQETHPLELKEVKYIWGDFTDASEQRNTLPFSFSANILTPLNLLEKLDVNIFEAPHDIAETWTYNTLYAKFRGTASARLSTRDGRPEVAAVHPLWCLANHSCDPNVTWEWAGEIQFTARETRVAWKSKGASGPESAQSTDEMKRYDPKRGGIAKGEEILNHYVDIDLPVEERRAWGLGALGGACLCERCLWESNAPTEKQ